MTSHKNLIEFWEQLKQYAKKQNLDIAWGKYNDKTKWLELNKNDNTPWFAFIIRDRPKEIACSLTVSFETCKKLKKDMGDIEKVFGYKLLFNDAPIKRKGQAIKRTMCRIEDSIQMDYNKYDMRMEIFQWYIDAANKYIEAFKSRLNVIDERTIIKK